MQYVLRWISAALDDRRILRIERGRLGESSRH
jgi:hypothetical protein